MADSVLFKRTIWALLICLIVQKINILFQFSFNYVDNDQLIYWNILADISNGIFHEPFFYGQDYNFPLEAYIAMPFYKMGIHACIILPIINVLMGLFPFLVIIYKAYHNKSYITSILILTLLCTLNLYYDIETAIPRGFIQGLFLSSIAFLLINKTNIISIFFIGFLLSLAFYINPNSLFLSILIFSLYIVNTYKIINKMNYLMLILAFVISYFLNYKMNLFYTLNPNYNLHFKMPLTYDVENLSRLAELDSLWYGLTPFVWHFATIILLIFIFFIVYFFKVKNYKFGLITSFIFILILLSVGVSKCGDGKLTPLFPYSRFYLSIPIIISLLIYIGNFTILIRKPLHFLLILICITFTYYKIFNTHHEIQKIFDTDAGVRLVSIDSLKSDCIKIESNLIKTNTELVVFAEGNPVLAYGCPCLFKNKNLKTLNPGYERRTWRINEENNIIRSQFLVYFYNLNNNLNDRFSFVYKYKVKNNDIVLYLYENNDKKIVNWLKSNNFKLRKYSEK